MISLRLNKDQKQYLEKVSDNKSEYIRKLIELDRSKSSLNKQEEMVRCKKDLSYFAENYCFLNTPQGKTEKMDLYSYQEDIIEVFDSNKDLFVVKGRQLGITTIIQVYCLWLTNFSDDRSIGVLFPRQNMTATFLDIFYDLYVNLPDWLSVKTLDKSRDEIVFRNGSTISSISKTSSKVDRMDFAIIEEASFIDRFSSFYRPIKRNSGQIVVTTNNILKDNRNYNTLKNIYQSSIDTMEISSSDHPDRDENEFKSEQLQYITKEDWLVEHEAFVEIESNE